MFLHSIFAHLVHNLFVCWLSILLYQSRPHQEGNHSQRLTEKVKAFCQQAASSTRKPLITSRRAGRGQKFWVGCQRSLARPVDVGEGVPQNPWLRVEPQKEGGSTSLAPLSSHPTISCWHLPLSQMTRHCRVWGGSPGAQSRAEKGGDKPRGQPACFSSWNETPRGQLC